ncbi:MAG: thiosulfate oxidation carrier protein SoxY [Cocleimonas sp.]
MKRRSFLKNTVVAGATGVAVSAGILSPNIASAASLAEAKSVDDALKALGATGAAESDKIKIKAPEIAENGAVVPVSITSEIDGTTEITSITAANPTPFAAKYTFGEGAVPAIKSRFKMGKTTDVIVVVKAGGKFYTAKTNVKVTKGGCGG